ncbi:SCP2 sterol-binding domain-containing protein [Amycolatopsis sp. YIM 10]|uniref:SCP2 sterol-binding domain-containing protein n=1 Tax=Amycolatopsis sp. YIM 10 TaxID=2653857 RepID=UPI00129066F8|nr:SCP2 sterol-binding domain-containing protein [Amycolatopsis sp. YIM 10]QFU90582.1 hypothetical protein YIM_27040 [Amycolatopsis sp. YIM 10]
MAVFPSREWLEVYVAKINESADFEAAARTFAADISFVFEAEPDNGVPRDIWCKTEFADGKCLSADYGVPEAEGRTAAFIIQAPYSRWKDVIGGKIDPIESMLDGDLAVTGHLPTLLRYVRATDELVGLAATAASGFIDEP